MGDLCGEHCLGGHVRDQALCQVAQRVGPPITGARVLHQAIKVLTLLFLSPVRSASWGADAHQGMHQHVKVMLLWASDATSAYLSGERLPAAMQMTS